MEYVETIRKLEPIRTIAVTMIFIVTYTYDLEV